MGRTYGRRRSYYQKKNLEKMDRRIKNFAQANQKQEPSQDSIEETSSSSDSEVEKSQVGKSQVAKHTTLEKQLRRQKREKLHE